jgi:hypothetical protein
MADDIQRLITEYLDGELSERDAQVLAEHLEKDEASRSEFIALARQSRIMGEIHAIDREVDLAEGVLAGIRARKDSEQFVDSCLGKLQARQTAGRTKRTFRRWLYPAVGLTAVALVVIGLILSRPAELATIASCQGNVRMVRSAKTLRPEIGSKLWPNDELLIPFGGNASFRYHDGTVISVRGDAQVSLRNGPLGKRITVLGGYVHADVKPQPEGRPLVIVTPHGEVEVVGTTFAVDVDGQETRLVVERGRVQLKNDHQAIDVQPYHSAIARSGGARALGVMDPDDLGFLSGEIVFEQVFARGRPKGEGWAAGELVTDDLPQGSTGAVRARRFDEAKLFAVQVYRETDPMFSFAKDVTIHVTYRTRRQGQLQIYLQGVDFPVKRFNRLRHGFAVPSTAPYWETFSLPLTDFVVKNPPKPEVVIKPSGERRVKRPPPCLPEGEGCRLLQFGSVEDLGLDIDRIWITRRSAPETQRSP